MRLFSRRRLAAVALSTTTITTLSCCRCSVAAFTTHASFSELVSRYDAFILDQFGVMHNGVSALDGAIECVEKLHKAGKSLIILSNTSAPAAAALKKLPKYGFASDWFTAGAVTSGEEASIYIRQKYGSSSSSQSTPPSKALMITWDTTDKNNPRLTALPEVFLSQCGNIQIATSPQDADFLLLHGSEVWYKGEEEPVVSLKSYIEEGIFDSVDPILKSCLEEGLPAVCANPDFTVRTPTGGAAYMPGKMAIRYQEMGGNCQIFGKPQVEHFQACIDRLGLDKSRVCHVGDSLHHDIVGANACGIPNVFITSGIHANDLKIEFGELPGEDTLRTLFDREQIQPTHVVSAFRL